MAWYPFNGNSDDESGNGNNGTVYGAVLDDDLNSLSNSNSYRFDGGDDYISIGNDSSLNPSSALSFSAWISLNNLNDRLNIILGRNNNNSGQDGYGFNFGLLLEVKFRYGSLQILDVCSRYNL